MTAKSSIETAVVLGNSANAFCLWWISMQIPGTRTRIVKTAKDPRITGNGAEQHAA